MNHGKTKEAKIHSSFVNRRAGGSGTRIVTKTQNAVHVMQGASAGKNR
jgi:hypothetical protein